MAREAGMTYSGVGVVYDAMDPFKVQAHQTGKETAGNTRRLGIVEVPWTRGESVFLLEDDAQYWAHVEEGLGTKNLVADAMYQLTGSPHYYQGVAQDTVAMIVNDMITLGALPISVAMHLAVGNSNWFNDKEPGYHLTKGWKQACDLARCTWGGGETPTLKGVVVPGTFVLAGSAMGVVQPKINLINPLDIQDGDAIIFVESSGIHANGLTLAREIGERKDPWWKKILHKFFPQTFPLRELPNGYLTKINDDTTFGDALLEPTNIYVGLVEDSIENHVELHYVVNITGHGWRKLMRAELPFAYIVEQLPTQLDIFKFIQKHGPLSDKEAYGNLNMGGRFSFVCPPKGYI